MGNRSEKDVKGGGAVTAADDTPTGHRGGVGSRVSRDRAGKSALLDKFHRLGASARDLIREVCTFEFLGLCTMLLPALMAGVGFFFGQTVTPLYFYVSVAILLVCAFVGGWKRGIAYVALLAFCAVLTMYTFSYRSAYDVQQYHFPMQHLLRNGWNPVFDSTVEKLYPLVEGTHLWFYHTLFLPKFQQLCGAIVSSALHLFVGDAFLGYVLIACLFATSLRFARRCWNVGVWMGLLFACCLTFSPKSRFVLWGMVDYSSYASFCTAALSLVLYRDGRRLSDLVPFVVSACICMTTKTTGILNVGLLVLLTLPLLWRRTAYWRALLALGFLVAVVGASPLLTNWIQYGSPFYPSMTFNPGIPVIDITCDFDLANADAQSMGYLSRICYAWVSPELTVATIRLLGGNPGFNPAFPHCPCAGIGLWFNSLLLMSAVLLAVSRKNIITWLCVVIFASSNFAPLKYIGYERYFPQIWAIFPLAAMNFIGTNDGAASGSRMKTLRKVVVVALVVALVGLSGMFLSSFVRTLGGEMAFECVRQRLVSSLPKVVEVDEPFFGYTVVQRFRQAGIEMSRGKDASNTDVWDWGLSADLPRKDPVTSRMVLPPRDETWPWNPKSSTLLCTDGRTGARVALDAWMNFHDREKALFPKVRGRALIHYFPHVLWD